MSMTAEQLEAEEQAMRQALSGIKFEVADDEPEPAPAPEPVKAPPPAPNVAAPPPAALSGGNHPLGDNPITTWDQIKYTHRERLFRYFEVRAPHKVGLTDTYIKEYADNPELGGFKAMWARVTEEHGPEPAPMQERKAVDHTSVEARAQLSAYKGGKAEWDTAKAWLNNGSGGAAKAGQETDDEPEDGQVIEIQETAADLEREEQHDRLVRFFDHHIPGGLTLAVERKIKRMLDDHDKSRDYDNMWKELVDTFGPEPAPPSSQEDAKYTGLFDRYEATHDSDDDDLRRADATRTAHLLSVSRGAHTQQQHATPVPQQQTSFQAPRVTSHMMVDLRLEQAPSIAYTSTPMGEAARVGFRMGLARDIAASLNLHPTQVNVERVATPGSGSMVAGVEIGLSFKDVREHIENTLLAKAKQGAFVLRNAREASYDHLSAKAAQMNVAAVRVVGGKSSPNFEIYRDVLVDSEHLAGQQRGLGGLSRAEEAALTKTKVATLGFTPADSATSAAGAATNASASSAAGGAATSVNGNLAAQDLPDLDTILGMRLEATRKTGGIFGGGAKDRNVLIPQRDEASITMSTTTLQHGKLPIGKSLFEQVVVTEADRERRAAELVFMAKSEKVTGGTSARDSNAQHEQSSYIGSSSNSRGFGGNASHVNVASSNANVLPGQYYATKGQTVDRSFHHPGRRDRDVLENIL